MSLSSRTPGRAGNQTSAAASERRVSELPPSARQANDSTLGAATAALSGNQTGVLAPIIAPDGTVTVLGGSTATLPATDTARGLAEAVAGKTGTTELTVGRDDFRS